MTLPHPAAPLRVLVVEDNEDDAAFVHRALVRHGLAVEVHRVDTLGDLRAALDGPAWDVVLCDYRLTDFDAPDALRLVQERRLDLPFVVVSGAIGEETAVAMMQAGAHDYVMKGRLERLPSAVERAVGDAGERRARHSAESALAEEHTARARLEGVLLATRTMEHHLNTHLAVTLGYLEAVVADPHLPHRLRLWLSDARAAADRAAAVLAQLSQVVNLEEAADAAAPDGPILDLHRAIAAPTASPDGPSAARGDPPTRHAPLYPPPRHP